MVVANIRLGVLLILSTFTFDTYAYRCHHVDQNTGKPLAQPTYLNVVLDLSKDGPVKIAKATPVSGEVILRDFQTSDFIYAVTSGRKTLAVAFLPEDPFLVRAFGDPNNGKETVSQSKSASLVINIPLDGSSAVSSLRLRLFKLVPETNVNNIDAAVLERLSTQKKLILIIDVPPGKFGRLIVRKLNAVRESSKAKVVP